jgi:hypothetical protein
MKTPDEFAAEVFAMLQGAIDADDFEPLQFSIFAGLAIGYLREYVSTYETPRVGANRAEAAVTTMNARVDSFIRVKLGARLAQMPSLARH